METDEQIIARKARSREVARAWSRFDPRTAARLKIFTQRPVLRTMPIGETIREGDMHRTKNRRKWTMAPPHHIGQSVQRANFYRTARPIPKPCDPRSIIYMTDLI